MARFQKHGSSKASEKSQPRQKPHVSQAVQDKLAEDDQDIAKLEKLLGIKGRKRLPKAFEDEGLAELLGDTGTEGVDEGRKRKREAAEWLRSKRSKQTKSMVDSEDEDKEERALSDEEASQSSADLSEDDTDTGSISSSQGEEEDDEEEGTEDEGTGDDSAAVADFSGFSDADEEETEAPQPGKQKTKARENPYVAPVQPSHQQQKYVPPSLRAPPSADSEALARLRRQLQGQLNKLSEANLVTILHEVENIYRENTRSNIRTTLIDLLFGLMYNFTSLQDTFIILHAGFITALYKVIGVEFGAEFLQRFVEHFDADYDHELKLIFDERNFREEDGAASTSKRKALVNAISLLSQLYNLHMVGCGLVFDYIRLFLADINELNTELLLKIIRNSGPQLRADDPSSLKDIVLMIQPAIAQTGEAAVSVRTKFMIETITDLKNNRMKTGAAANSSRSAEHLTQVRKALGALNNSRTLRANEPLRVGRSDILNAATRGKWWLVGASWKGGDIKPDSTSELTNDSGTQNVVLSADILREENDEVFDEEADAASNVDLLQLARAHRMNTDVRRSIFIAIMSAVDHRDAQYRIAKLHLKRRQEVEITRVLMHCAGEEDTYNPYYTLIARQLCGDRRLRMAFMFSLWDSFRRMGERGDDFDEDDNDEEYMDMDADQDAQTVLQPKAVVNLAKMFANLVVEGALQLKILKVLDFAYMQPKTKVFVENLIVTIILQSQQKAFKEKKRRLKKKGQRQSSENEDDPFDEKALVDVFSQARDTPQIVSGLIFFVRKTVSKSDIAPAHHDLVQKGGTVIVDTLRVISEGRAQI